MKKTEFHSEIFRGLWKGHKCKVVKEFPPFSIVKIEGGEYEIIKSKYIVGNKTD